VRSHDPAWWNRSIGPPWTPASCSFASELSSPGPAKTLAVAMPDRARTNVTPNARTPRLARLTRPPSDSSSVDWFGLPVNRPIGHFVSRTTYYAASSISVEGCRAWPRIRGGTPATTRRQAAIRRGALGAGAKAPRLRSSDRHQSLCLPQRSEDLHTPRLRHGQDSEGPAPE